MSKEKKNGANKNRTMSVALCCLLCLVFAEPGILGAPTWGERFELKQPDGTTAEVRIWGDEFYQVVESLDGYTLARDMASGVICYARLSADEQELVSTGIKMLPAAPVGLGVGKHVRIAQSSVKKKVASARLRFRDGELFAGGQSGVPLPAAPCTGNVRALCLIIDFLDEAGTISPSEVDDYCNQVGYSGNGNNGSVRDYFYDVSDGDLTYTNYVPSQYYTAINNKSYYDNPSESAGPKARELILEALNDLESKGFDFSQYDSNGDGYVDGVNAFYAGNRGSGWSKGLWPHSWTVWFSADGVSTYKYQITDMRSSLRLRTFCHENGHMICYWPDLYDYDYDSAGAGRFCLMAYGGADANPVQPGAYLKAKAGWANVSTSAGVHTLTAGVNSCFKFPHPSLSNEYYLVENRQATGRDSSLPDSGIAIWHVDEYGSNDNQQMTQSSHYECTLVQADGDWDLENNRNYGDSTDLWAAPGYTTCGPSTYPNTSWWSGDESGLLITNISASGSSMTFTVGAEPYNITGRVAHPVDPFGPPGGRGVNTATVSAAGESALTPKNGSYTLTGLPSGTHTVTVSKTGYSFTPTSQDVTGPPDATNVNFTGTCLGQAQVTIDCPSTAQPGEAFTATVYLENIGQTTSGDTYLDFSFPENPAVAITGYSGWLKTPKLRSVGSTVNNRSQQAITTTAVLVTGEREGIAQGQVCSIEVSITPPSGSAGSDLHIYYRGTIGDKIDPTDAESPTRDQQDWPVYVKTVHIDGQYTLSVQSTPDAGAAITGTYPGTTNYTASVAAATAVTLTAPWEHAGKFFLRWKNSGGTTLTYHGTNEFTMPASDNTVIAEYGDVTEFYVNDATPEPPVAAGDDANPGTSPEAPMATIQTLLDRYPNIGTGCTVHVSDGTYVENISIGSSHSGLTLQGAGRDVTTVDGDSSATCFWFDNFEGGMISGFTITNGYAPTNGQTWGSGAGIYCFESSPTITNNTISNSAAWAGGGIFCSESSPTIISNIISGNTADGSAGGIYCYNSSATITDNTIISNAANSGGGIVSSFCSSTITNNTIAGNTASSGGGMYCYPNLSATITSNTITGNTASYYHGGGIYCAYTSSPTITSNIIKGNTANGSAGGIYCAYTSSPTITSNTITGNTASSGGGIFCSESSPTITSNTITGNTASSGGGMYCDESLSPTITNTILWGNTAPDGPEIYLSVNSTLTVSYSDVAGGEGGAYVGPDCTLTWGPGNIDADPLFADPANDDYHLKSARGRWDPATETWVTDAVTSPCIDAGDPASDYSSEPAPNGGRINMGVWGNTDKASKSPPAAIDDLAASLTAKLTVASATASTVLYNRYVAANATDGNPNTFWSSSKSPVPRTESLTLDLGATQAVAKVRLLPRATSPELFPGDFTIDVSKDGDNWTPVVSETGYIGQSNVWYEKSFGVHFARYVRIAGPSMLVGDGRIQYYLQIAEFEVYKLRDADGSKLNVPSATCSTVLYNRFPAANVIDGDPNTFWSSMMSPVPRTEYLILDLGGTQTVGKVRLLPRASYPELFPGDFTMDVSIDGDNWTQAVSETGYTGQRNVWYEKSFSGRSTRYVKLAGPSMLIGDGRIQYYLQIAEFEVYAAGPEAVKLSWTAPGDGGYVGTAASYEARYSTSQITTEAIWDAATAIAGEPAPQAAGTSQSMYVSLSDLPTNARLYFGVRTTSQSGSESRLSNSPFVDTPGPLPPAAIDDLAASLTAKLNASSATCSTVLYNRFVAANAIDGNPDTFWSSNMSTVPRTESLTLDLGATQAVMKVRLLPRASYPELFPGDFTIDTSPDGDNWTQAVSETGYVGQSNVWYEKSFSVRSARYVRIAGPSMLIGDGRIQYYLQIAEFEVYKLRDVAGSKLNVPSATSSGNLYGRFVAANAIDGNPNTFWSSTMSTVPRAEYLALDLGAAETIGMVRLLPWASYPELFPGDFTIDVSTDGDNWTPAVSETGYTGQSNVWYEKSFVGTSARYVKLAGPSMLIGDGRIQYYLQIAEFEVYAAGPEVVKLSWTAPGDGGYMGTAASYEARYNTQEITTQAIWDAATGVTGEPAPEIAGTSQSMTINTSALPAAARVYFAIRTTNQAAVESGISNSPYVDTPAAGSGASRPAASRETLPGDANGDCRVDIIDLVFIGARLGQDVHTGENWRADVNRDGFIDVFDMILVRDHLNTTCK